MGVPQTRFFSGGDCAKILKGIDAPEHIGDGDRT